MITFPMLVLVVVPLVAGIESLFVKRERVWGVAALAGIGAGAFVWNCFEYWVVFPVVSLVFLALAAGLIVRLFVAGTEVLKKGGMIAAGTAIVLFLSWNVVLVSLVNGETVSDVEVLNPGGSAGAALVVYHPGRSGFPRRIHEGFAEGLVSSDWRVEMTTASSQAPVDLSGYDLLVLGAPTYEWRPAARIQRYLKGLGDLGGQPTVVIISGAGYTGLSLPTMEKLVREANGNLVASLALWTMAPNLDARGDFGDPVGIAREVARGIPVPQE